MWQQSMVASRTGQTPNGAQRSLAVIHLHPDLRVVWSLVLLQLTADVLDVLFGILAKQRIKHRFGDSGDGQPSEQIANRWFDPKSFGEAPHHLHCEKRVAANREEIIMATDMFNAKQFGPHFRNGFLSLALQFVALDDGFNGNRLR